MHWLQPLMLRDVAFACLAQGLYTLSRDWERRGVYSVDMTGGLIYFGGRLWDFRTTVPR